MKCYKPLVDIVYVQMLPLVLWVFASKHDRVVLFFFFVGLGRQDATPALVFFSFLFKCRSRSRLYLVLLVTINLPSAPDVRASWFLTSNVLVPPWNQLFRTRVMSLLCGCQTVRNRFRTGLQFLTCRWTLAILFILSSSAYFYVSTTDHRLPAY